MYVLRVMEAVPPCPGQWGGHTGGVIVLRASGRLR